MTDTHHRAAVAERAARAGGAVARERFRGALAVETKANKNDVVTEADRDAQRQVMATIQGEFPNDSFVCEEDVGPVPGSDNEGVLVDSVPDTGATWVVDPIDGTANFVRGMPLWTTSIAAIVDGETVGSATYVPAQGDLYAAGESATRDGAELSVSDRSDPETFAVSPVGWWDRDDRGEFSRLCTAVAERFGDMRRLGSFQLTLATVADGGLDGAICTRKMYPWDTIAGVHMIREAGGTVTDLDGNEWDRDSDSLVASNGQAHDELLAAAGQALS